jgi:hypothetical protein
VDDGRSVQLEPSPAEPRPTSDGPAPDAPRAGVSTPVRRSRWWVEVAAIAWLYWIYDALNDQSPIRQRTALANASDVFRLERRLHLDADWWLDRWTAHHHWIGVVLADFYDTAHLWAALAALVWLWWWRPALYPHLRNVLVVVNVVGFLVFWLYPVAPPRMLPGFVDVVVQDHAWFSWHSGTLATHANQLAAMPSLHVSWALWVAVAIWQGTRSHAWRAVGVAHVVLTVVSVMATGNHYALDVLAGAATVGVAMAAVSLLEGRVRARARMGSTGSTANSERAAAS